MFKKWSYCHITWISVCFNILFHIFNRSTSCWSWMHKFYLFSLKFYLFSLKFYLFQNDFATLLPENGFCSAWKDFSCSPCSFEEKCPNGSSSIQFLVSTYKPAMSIPNGLLSQKLCHCLKQGRTLNNILMRAAHWMAYFDLSKLNLAYTNVMKAFES